MSRFAAGWSDQDMFSTSSAGDYNKHVYERIHEQGDSLFFIRGVKRGVILNTQEDITTISEYLDFDINAFLKTFGRLSGYDTSNTLILRCDSKCSLSVVHRSDVTTLLLTGKDLDEIWNEEKSNAIPLDVFMNPDKYEEYFI